MTPTEGPEAGEEESGVVYECWAGIDTVWQRDFEQAKANGTLEDITVFIRDTRGTFVPTDKHSVIVLDSLYTGKLFNVKAVQPDLKDKRFITMVLQVIS